MVEIKDGKTGAIYEFIAPTRLTEALALSAYNTHRINGGKRITPRILSCSDFKGENVFEIEVSP